MTRTISLITATVGAALLLAGPATADNWGADRNSDSVGYINPDKADRAATLEQQQLANMLDAREKSQTANRPQATGESRAIFVDDRFALHAQNVPATATATSSGREIDLEQIGFGFGMGILLATGLALALRYTRLHRLAH